MNRWFNTIAGLLVSITITLGTVIPLDSMANSAEVLAANAAQQPGSATVSDIAIFLGAVLGLTAATFSLIRIGLGSAQILSWKRNSLELTIFKTRCAS